MHVAKPADAVRPAPFRETVRRVLRPATVVVVNLRREEFRDALRGLRHLREQATGNSGGGEERGSVRWLLFQPWICQSDAESGEVLRVARYKSEACSRAVAAIMPSGVLRGRPANWRMPSSSPHRSAIACVTGRMRLWNQMGTCASIDSSNWVRRALGGKMVTLCEALPETRRSKTAPA